jgi:hypothetical protein
MGPPSQTAPPCLTALLAYGGRHHAKTSTLQSVRIITFQTCIRRKFVISIQSSSCKRMTSPRRFFFSVWMGKFYGAVTREGPDLS